MAGRTGQELNASALAGDAGVAVKAPKLHLLDSGLACHLLGIHTSTQLHAHPLRGALFESWVVSEVAKARLHAGLPLRMFHYREARGPEVDLLVQGEKYWIALEAKSGATVDASFFAGMEAFSARLPKGTALLRRLVHGGQDQYRRQGVDVAPWSEIQGVRW